MMVQRSNLDHFRAGIIFNMTVADVIAAATPSLSFVSFPIKVQIIQGQGATLSAGKRLLLFLGADGQLPSVALP